MLAESTEIMRLHQELISGELFVFPIKGKVNICDKHGVYIIYSPSGQVLHVGTTKYGKGGLNQRLTNHITKTGVFYREYLRPNSIEMKGNYLFRFLEVPNPRTRALLEALTAGLLCPAHFGIGEKRNKI